MSHHMDTSNNNVIHFPSDDILEGEYPIATLYRDKSSLPNGVRKMLLDVPAVHENQGTWAAHDGIAYIGLRIPDRKLARKVVGAKSKGILLYNWPTAFGRIISFSLTARGVKNARRCRTLVPFSHKAIEVMISSGKAVFVLINGQSVAGVYSGNFREHPQSAIGFSKVLRYPPDNKEFVCDTAAYWQLHKRSQEQWSDRLSPSYRQIWCSAI